MARPRKYEPPTGDEMLNLALRAEALMLGLQPGVGLAEAATQLGVPLDQLIAWARVAEHFKLTSVFKGSGSRGLADAYEGIARMAMAHITPEKMERASAKDLLQCADIATKNMLLNRGQATAISETVSSDGELVAKVRDFAAANNISITMARDQLKALLDDSAARAKLDALIGDDRSESAVVNAILASEVKQ